MGSHLVCWRCGNSLKKVPLPLIRLAQCPACSSDLHVCRLCRFYDPKLSGHCNHDLAEPAREVDVANFCHYFRPTADAYMPPEKTKQAHAAAQLQALFGQHSSPDDPAHTDASADAKTKFDALFKTK